MNPKPIEETSELELLGQLRDLQLLAKKVNQEIALINQEINRRLDNAEKSNPDGPTTDTKANEEIQ